MVDTSAFEKKEDKVELIQGKPIIKKSNAISDLGKNIPINAIGGTGPNPAYLRLQAEREEKGS